MCHMHSCSISTFATFHFLNVYFRIFLHPDGSHENGAKECSPPRRRGVRIQPSPSNPRWVASSRLETCSLQSLTLPTSPDWGTMVQAPLHRRQVLMARQFSRPGNYRVVVSHERHLCCCLRCSSLLSSSLSIFFFSTISFHRGIRFKCIV